MNPISWVYVVQMNDVKAKKMSFQLCFFNHFSTCFNNDTLFVRQCPVAVLMKPDQVDFQQTADKIDFMRIKQEQQAQ